MSGDSREVGGSLRGSVGQARGDHVTGEKRSCDSGHGTGEREDRLAGNQCMCEERMVTKPQNQPILTPTQTQYSPVLLEGLLWRRSGCSGRRGGELWGSSLTTAGHGRGT